MPFAPPYPLEALAVVANCACSSGGCCSWARVAHAAPPPRPAGRRPEEPGLARRERWREGVGVAPSELVPPYGATFHGAASGSAPAAAAPRPRCVCLPVCVCVCVRGTHISQSLTTRGSRSLRDTLLRHALRHVTLLRTHTRGPAGALGCVPFCLVGTLTIPATVTTHRPTRPKSGFVADPLTH
eukprot:COSAG02_NODE_21751_length_776_cov_0.951256_1_plen_183_part_01